MGSPLRGRGLSVLDRNEGLVSPLRSGTLVRPWLDLPPLSAGVCAPGPQGVLPDGAPLTVGLLPGLPTLLCPLSAGCPVGWEASPSGEAFASSCQFSWRPGAAGALAVTLPEAASQREFFPLCLILPLPGSVSFFIAFVPLLEAMSESLTHSFPRSFLVVALSASAVGFADALWLCPGRTLCRFFASVSWFAPVALSPLLHRVFPDGFRLWCAFRFAEGRLPWRWSHGALGELRWLHLYCLTPDLVGLLLFARCLGAPVGVLCLLCDIPPVFLVIF